MTQLRCNLSEVISLPTGTFAFRMSIDDEQAPAYASIVILNETGGASFAQRPGERGVVLTVADRYCELHVEGQADVLLAVAASAAAAPGSVEVELTDLDEETAGVDRTTDLAVVAHISRIGDVRYQGDEWIGDPAGHRQIEGFTVDWPSCPHNLTLHYRAALANGELTDWCQPGAFAGTRGRSTGLTSVSFCLGGSDAAQWSLTADAVYAGQVISETGSNIVLSGPTAREVLAGLRIGLARKHDVEADVAMPATDREPAKAEPEHQGRRNFSRVKMYKSSTAT